MPSNFEKGNRYFTAGDRVQVLHLPLLPYLSVTQVLE